MFKHFDPIKEAVTKGAEWLDENAPGWLDKVDLESLNIADGYNCVLGQVFKLGGFKAWLTGNYDRCGYVLVTKYRGSLWPIKFGFAGENARLKDAWTDEILSRRALQNACG